MESKNGMCFPREGWRNMLVLWKKTIPMVFCHQQHGVNVAGKLEVLLARQEGME
jgi:hypothetical protein